MRITFQLPNGNTGIVRRIDTWFRCQVIEEFPADAYGQLTVPLGYRRADQLLDLIAQS